MDAQGDTSMDEDFPMTSQEESPNPKKGKTVNWLTSMKSVRVDAFSQDSDSVKEARAHYFTTHSWDWTHSNMADLSDIFKELTQEAGLLGESIFEIHWSWKGPEHLKHANCVFQSQPKGLKFLRLVSAKESPKEMGLKGIHDPEALWHFARYTYCPWCGKSGQNEGTVMNHLRMVHYKLGLICDQCFGCPTTTSKLSADMAMSPAPIRALPPRRALSLSPHGVCLGDFISTDPLPQEGHDLRWEKGIDCHPSNSIL